MLSVKQKGIVYYFWVFDMIRPGSEHLVSRAIGEHITCVPNIYIWLAKLNKRSFGYDKFISAGHSVRKTDLYR